MKISTVILERERLLARRINWSDLGAVKVDYSDILGLETAPDNGRPSTSLRLNLKNGRDVLLVLKTKDEADRLNEELREILEPGVLRETKPFDLEGISAICEDLLASKGANVRKAADFLITQGLAHNVSDIALDPAEEGGIRVRFKIDGRLFDVARFDREVGRRLIGSLKVASGMVLYREDIIQEGRMSRRTPEGEQDLRVSVMPSDGGERVSIRTFDKLKGSSQLDDLGFGPEILEALQKICAAPQGLFIISGPSGSGKTTTLYAMLRHIRSLRESHSGMVTLEDPVEYRLRGVTQVRIEPGKGLEFADALKSSLRQDPGVIMVGEIRDSETADAVVQAALTGHLVLTTVHCGSAAEAVTRLLDLGVRPFLLRSVLQGVLCQRLIRMVCRECGTEANISGDEREMWPDKIFTGTGCDACRGTGYLGRTVAAEFLPVTDEVGKLISGSADTGGIARVSEALGMVTLKRAGLKLVEDRVADPKEIKRVLG